MSQKQLKQIEKLVIDYFKNTEDSQHGFNHASRVKQNALKIADILGVKDNINLNLLQATCLLHDIAYSKKSRLPSSLRYLFEGILAKKIVTEAIRPLNIENWEKQIILEAVSKHSKSFPFKRLNKKGNIYTKILQDADTLDFFNEQRVNKFKKINNYTGMVSPLINWFISYGKKNLSKFLNFPELAIYFPFPNTFSYLEWRKSNSNKETFLCIHGYADRASFFIPFAKALSNHYRIIAIDLPMWHKDKICSVIELANYLENFCKKIGLKRFSLVGFSLGGLVGIEYSIRYPKRINSLFILNSLPRLILSDKLIKLFKTLKPLFLLKTSLYIYSRVSTNKLVRRFLSNPILEDEYQNKMRYKYMSIFGTLLNNLDYSKTEKFNRLPFPKTIVLFKDDEIFKWSYVKDYSKTLKSKLKVINIGGHASKKSYWKAIVKLF